MKFSEEDIAGTLPPSGSPRLEDPLIGTTGLTVFGGLMHSGPEG